MRLHLNWTVLAALASMSLGACGGSGPATNSLPGVAAPPATTSPPASVSSWNQVSEQTTCEAMQPAFCLGAFGFSVSNDGHFTEGPDDSGSTQQGQVTPEELSSLASAADTIAAQTLDGQSSCIPMQTIPGVSDHVTLILKSGSGQRIYDLSLKGECTQGGKENAEKLQSAIRALMKKYYLTPFPPTN